MIQIYQLLIGSMRNFVYLLLEDGEAYVVDPQPDLKPWQEILEQTNSTLKGVLLTHTHHDHVGGVPKILDQYPNAKIYVHPGDTFRLKSTTQYPDRFVMLKDQQELTLGKSKLTALHTPGHSAGECCFLIQDSKPWRLLTGDTVFVGTVGRTDLETGDDEALFNTLQKIKALPQSTVIYPGHDYGPTPISTVENECIHSDAFQCQTVEELKEVP